MVSASATEGNKYTVASADFDGIPAHWCLLRSALHAASVGLPANVTLGEAEALSLLLCAPVATRKWTLRVQLFRGSLILTSSLDEHSKGGTLRSPQSIELEAALAGVPAHAVDISSASAGDLVLTQRTVGNHNLWVLSRVPLSTAGSSGLQSYTQVCCIPSGAAAQSSQSALSAMEALQVYSGHFLSGVGHAVVVRAVMQSDSAAFTATRPLRAQPEKVSHSAWSRSSLLRWMAHALQWVRQQLTTRGDAHQNSVAYLHCSGVDSSGTAPRLQISANKHWSDTPNISGFVPPIVPPLDIAVLCSKRLLRAPLPPSLHSGATTGAASATGSRAATPAAATAAAAAAGPSAAHRSVWCSRPELPPHAAAGCRLAIIVPFRDQAKQNRAKQLGKFLDHMPSFIEKYVKPAPISWRIFIVQQSQDNFKFNRGKLLNIGSILAMDGRWEPSKHVGTAVDMSSAQTAAGASAESAAPALPSGNAEATFNALCLHDVDLLPSEALGAWYAGCSDTDCIHPADAWPRYADVMGDAYLGGVLTVPPSAMLASNGFSNHYWGWGGEEDALAMRLKRAGVHIVKPPAALRRPGVMQDLEEAIPGERAGVKVSQGGRSEWLNMTKKELLVYERQKGATWASWDGVRSVDFTVLQVLSDTPQVLHVEVDLHARHDPYAAREQPEDIKEYTGLTAQAVQAGRAKREREEAEDDHHDAAGAGDDGSAKRRLE